MVSCIMDLYHNLDPEGLVVAHRSLKYYGSGFHIDPKNR